MPEIEMFTFIIGLIIGILVAYTILRSAVRREFEAKFAKWCIEHEDKIRQDALESSRAIIKGKVGEQFAPLLPLFKYNPSDARFIGSPVDLIVFDGYSESKENMKIVFVEVKTSKNPRLTKVEQLIRDAILKGRVNYEVLQIEVPE